MLKHFEEKKFDISELKGISAKTIEEHLKLYSGYVKNANVILSKIDEYSKDAEPMLGAELEHAYALSEIHRRFGFEFDGMRNHEYYFAHFQGGTNPLGEASELRKAIEEEWGNFDRWLSRFKTLALTRGVGWAILYYDPHTKRLINAWIDEQHLGHLTGLQPILALDMWEHSYYLDYTPADKKKYVEAFFDNLNWQTCEFNFTSSR